MDPYDLNAYNNKGIALNKIERYEEAIEAFSEALKLNEEDMDALFNKANALNNL